MYWRTRNTLAKNPHKTHDMGECCNYAIHILTYTKGYLHHPFKRFLPSNVLTFVKREKISRINKVERHCFTSYFILIFSRYLYILHGQKIWTGEMKNNVYRSIYLNAYFRTGCDHKLCSYCCCLCFVSLFFIICCKTIVHRNPLKNLKSQIAFYTNR